MKRIIVLLVTISVLTTMFAGCNHVKPDPLPDDTGIFIDTSNNNATTEHTPIETNVPSDTNDQTGIGDNPDGKTYTLLLDDTITGDDQILKSEYIEETGIPDKTVTLFGNTYVLRYDETSRSSIRLNDRLRYEAIDSQTNDLLCLASFDAKTGALMYYSNVSAGMDRSYQSEVNDKSGEAEFLAYAQKLVSQYASVEGCEVEISTKIFEYNAWYENYYTKMQIGGYVNNAEDAPDFYAIYHITFYKTIDGIRRFDTHVIEINNTGEVHRASFDMQDELYAEVAGVKIDMQQAESLTKKSLVEYIPDTSTVEFVPSLIATNDGNLWLHLETFVKYGDGTSGYSRMIRLAEAAEE